MTRFNCIFWFVCSHKCQLKLYHYGVSRLFLVIAKNRQKQRNVNLIKFDGVFVGTAVVIRGFSYADWGCPTGKIANGKVCIGRASHHYVFVNVLSEYSNLKMPFDIVDTWKKVDNSVIWVVKFSPREPSQITFAFRGG